mgnify:CR=1 FL=1
MDNSAPTIIEIKGKTLIGMSKSMSYTQDKTKELWQGFGPRIKSISHKKDNLMYSVNIYPTDFHENSIDPDKRFVKWAAIEVNQKEKQEGLDFLEIESGKYAVFLHKGTADNFRPLMEFIFNDWIPNSEYELDHRPHFEVLRPGYMPDDPNAEEEVWIPIK